VTVVSAASAPPAPSEAAPPSTAAPASPSPGGANDVKYYQELAKRLQETLDDPQKLAEYFTAKAAKEYANAPVQKIDLKDVPSKGPANAPVQVVEYSDFLCPFCRNLAGAFTQFIPQSGNRVVVYFKNYPLDKECNPSLKQTVHPGACWMAMGAVCAINQGKFQAYHDRVFATELHDPKPADVGRVAAEAGLNAAEMETCLADPRTREKLVAQIEEGQRLGVQATPTLFVNGKKLPRIEDFLATVDKEARAKGFPPMAEAKAK
jgi:protein-disulfide isomerase